MNTIFFIVIGMFVGWNFPQPTYAKLVQDWVLSKWISFGKK